MFVLSVFVVWFSFCCLADLCRFIKHRIFFFVSRWHRLVFSVSYWNTKRGTVTASGESDRWAHVSDANSYRDIRSINSGGARMSIPNSPVIVAKMNSSPKKTFRLSFEIFIFLNVGVVKNRLRRNSPKSNRFNSISDRSTKGDSETKYFTLVLASVVISNSSVDSQNRSEPIRFHLWKAAF